MGLFHFARKKRVPAQGFAAKPDMTPLDLQAFSLEPILTPSGLVDAPDHTLNGMDWVDHPGTDWHNSDLAALPDSRHVDVTPAHTTDASAAHPTATGDHDLVLSGSGYGSAQTETTAQPLTGGGYGDAGTQAPTPQLGDAHANTPVSTTLTAPTATTTTGLPAVDQTIASPASASVVGAAVAPQPLVGIIDTGFAAQNAHLDYSHITLGHDYVDGDNNPLLQPGRGNDHGTGILGIVEATQKHGVEGLHDSTPIWLGRATGSGHWADSLVEFVNHTKATGNDHAVVNLSFDLTQTNSDGSVSTRFAFTPQELAALHYAHANHVLIVAAAGNQDGAMSALGQASQQFDNIITVGAADGLERAGYSSYGDGLDLLANGGTPEHPILTTMGEGRGAVAGSSAAAAQVTGAVSLVWQANPDLSYRQVINLLEHSATDVGTAGWDATTGFGVINLAAAIDLAKQTPPDTAGATANFIPIPWATSDDLTTGERPTDDWSEPLSDTTSGDGAGTGTDEPATPPVAPPAGADPTGADSAQTDATPADSAASCPAAADQATDAPPESDMSGDDINSDAASDVPTDDPEGDSSASGSEPTGDSPDESNEPEPDGSDASNPPPSSESQGGYDLGYSYGLGDGSGFREGVSSWSGYSLYNLYGGGGWFASATFLADYLAGYNKGFIDGWIYTDAPTPSSPPEASPDPTTGDGYGSATSGNGYGSTGDGYGSATSGNGYGSTGDGYGSATSGNGYGSTGDGYGSATSGNGYGSTGDGYGSATSGNGYGSTGDGYGSATSGNGYGSTGDGYGSATSGNGYGSTGDGYGSNDYGAGDGDSSTGAGDGSSTAGDTSEAGNSNDSTGNDDGGDTSEADNGVTTADPGIGAGSTGAFDGSGASGDDTGSDGGNGTDPTTGAGDEGTLGDSGDNSDPIGTDAGNGSNGDAPPDGGGDGTIPSGTDTGDGHDPNLTPGGDSDAPTGTDAGNGHDAGLTPGGGADTVPVGTDAGSDAGNNSTGSGDSSSGSSSAIGSGYGSDSAGNGADDDTSGTDYGSITTDPGDDLDKNKAQDPCMDRLKKIRALIAELIERAGALTADPETLQFDHWSRANPKIVRLPDGRERNLGSVEGHQEQFTNKQKSLRNLLSEWDNNDCGDKTGSKITKSDRDWAFKDVPKPEPKPRPSESQGFQLPDWAAALGVVIVGGAIVIGATVTLPAWALAALTVLAATAGLQLIDQRP